MDAQTALLVIGTGVGVAGMAALLVHLSRSRARVMGYHDIATPRVNEASHGGGPAE